MFNEFADNERDDEKPETGSQETLSHRAGTASSDDDGFLTLQMSEDLMEVLERSAAAHGRSVDEEAAYIMKVVLGLQSADPNDTAGRETAMLLRCMRSARLFEG